MKTKIVNLLIFLSLFSFVPAVLAQSPTPDEAVKEIREAVKEKVRKNFEETQKGQKKAFVGKITEVSNSTLTLETQTGKQQTKVEEETTIIGKNKNEIDFDDLEIDNYLIAMGYLSENGILQAKRVIVTEKAKTPNQQVAVGRVTDISADEKIITVKNEKKEIIYTVEATSKTIITQKSEDGKVEKVSFNKIKDDDWLVAIGTPSENEEKIITAKLIHFVPGKSKPKVTPTPKVEEEPTPSSVEEE